MGWHSYVFLYSVRAGPGRRHCEGQRAAAPGVPDTTSLKLTLLILPIISLLHYFSWRTFVVPAPLHRPLTWDGERRDHFTSRVQSTPSAALLLRHTRRISALCLSGRAGHQPSSGVSAIVPEATPNGTMEIIERNGVLGKYM